MSKTNGRGGVTGSDIGRWRHDLMKEDVPEDPRTVGLYISVYFNLQGKESFPSIETIAGQARKSKKTVLDAIKWLEVTGRLDVQRRPGKGGRIRNVYSIPAAFAVLLRKPQTGDVDPVAVSENHVAVSGNGLAVFPGEPDQEDQEDQAAAAAINLNPNLDSDEPPSELTPERVRALTRDEIAELSRTGLAKGIALIGADTNPGAYAKTILQSGDTDEALRDRLTRLIEALTVAAGPKASGCPPHVPLETRDDDPEDDRGEYCVRCRTWNAHRDAEPLAASAAPEEDGPAVPPEPSLDPAEAPQ